MQIATRSVVQRHVREDGARRGRRDGVKELRVVLIDRPATNLIRDFSPQSVALVHIVQPELGRGVDRACIRRGGILDWHMD